MAGGGALVATGAFTTVEAQRTVNVETAGDAEAFLAMTPARGDYVEQTNGTIEINLDSTVGDADGLNQNAISIFDDIVEIENQGTQAITSLEFEFGVTGSVDDSAHENALGIRADGQNFADGSPTTGDITGDITIEGGDSDELDVGESLEFGLRVDLINHGIQDIDDDAEVTLTIIANTD